MVIDIHAHVGRLREHTFARRALDDYARRCIVARVLVSNRDAADQAHGGSNATEIEANTACLELCRGEPRLVPLYWVRPGQSDSNVFALAGALASEPFAGAIFSPVLNGFPADADVLDPYFNVLARLGLAAAIHTGDDELASPGRVYTLARRHPRVAIVMFGALAGAHGRDAIGLVQRALERDDARLYLDTAHAGVKEVVAAVATVGPERVLYGSDLIRGERAQIEHRGQLLDDLRTALPPDQFQKITTENAAKLFRLPAETRETS